MKSFEKVHHNSVRFFELRSEMRKNPESHGVVYPWLLTSDGGLPVSVFVL